MIPLTRNKIAHLAVALLPPPARGQAHRTHWSNWRRRHQYHARTCHYRRQATRDP
jgi:hypothetical protein